MQIMSLMNGTRTGERRISLLKDPLPLAFSQKPARQGLKPAPPFRLDSARLKPCPFTRPGHEHTFQQAGRPVNRIAHPVFAGAFALAVAAFTALASAQYPGQMSSASKDDKTPTLRAVGVLEWTGDVAHPKSSRLVPITVYDGNQLQDASIYLTRPQPLALQSEVEYQLLSDGKVTGLFDIQSAGQLQGCWVGLGKWKALPAPKPDAQLAHIDEEDDVNNGPVLHRKARSGDSSSGTSSGGGSGTPDPDRPTLHRNDSSSDSSADSAGSSGSGAGQPAAKSASEKDTAYVSSLPDVTDPNRPRLVRGKPADSGTPEAPTLVGLPEEMQQSVAVSDVRNRPEHLWSYSWASPDTESEMKADLESIAREALGLNAPALAPAVPAKSAKASKATASLRAKSTGTAPPASAAPPASLSSPLLDEQFRVFELAYGGGATMVFSSRVDTAPSDGTAGSSASIERFVTLVAQPDLYGKVVVLLKDVTDSAHLDATPRMRLIDAVDALADNRGDLLFEMRGATQRQFALYRVLRGQATKIFEGSGGALGSVAAR
jgi:hypothetical protein